MNIIGESDGNIKSLKEIQIETQVERFLRWAKEDNLVPDDMTLDNFYQRDDIYDIMERYLFIPAEYRK